MNVLTIVGNLGKDAERKNVGQAAVLNFSVAAKSGYGDKEQTIWIDCAIWGKQAEGKIADYLKKGQQVCVSGEFGTREYEGKTYITMRVASITLCGGKDKSAPQQEQTQRQSEEDDDGIPF